MRLEVLVVCVIQAACSLSWHNPSPANDAGADGRGSADGPLIDGAAVDSAIDAASDTMLDAPSLELAKLEAWPLRVRANGIARSTLTFELTNANGDPVPGETVALAIASGAATLTPMSGVTDSKGMLVAHLRSTTLGTVTVSATAAGFTRMATVTMTSRCDAPLMPGASAAPINGSVVGDFNGDGHLDLVGVMPYGIGFASGNGDGSFNEPELTKVSVRYGTLVAGDFTGDGVLDVAGVGNGQVADVVFVLPNRGNAIFAPPLTVASTTYAQTAVAADFDVDGKLDYAFSAGSNQGLTVTVLFGEGDGTFDGRVDISNAPMGTGAALLAADADGDGDPDLLSGSYYQTSIALNASQGASRTFAAAQHTAIEGGTDGFGSIAAAHVDGDNALDIVVGRYTSMGLTFVLDAFTPTRQVRQQALGGVRGDSVRFVDVNGDSKLDLVVGDAFGLQISLGDGAGSFATAVRTQGPPTSGLELGDFTSDGKLDLAAGLGNLSGLFVGDGLGQFSGPAFAVGGSTAVAVGDFTGDGVADHAAVPLDPWGTNQSIEVRHVLAGGTFAAPITYNVGARPDAIVAGDLDGDADVDLAVSTTSGVRMLLNNGSGSFASGALLIALPPQTRHRGLVVADFTGDGRRDVAVVREGWGAGTAQLIVARNSAIGFTTTSPTTLPAGVWWTVAADIDADSKLDLVVHGQLAPRWLHGNGDGTFGSAQTIYSGGGLLVGGIAVADMNGDAKLDVLASSIDVQIHHGNGNGTFQAPLTIASYTAGNPVAAVDINGDGHRDVLTRGESALAVILGRGNNIYDSPRFYAGALTDSYAPTYATDFTGDGRLDLAGPGGVQLQSACTP